MEQQHASFNRIPNEVKKIIIASAFDISQTQYEMRVNQSDESLLIPYTLRPINPVIETQVGQLEPHSIIAKPGDRILLDSQLWFDKNSFYSYKLRLDQDTLDIDDRFTCSSSSNEKMAFFDGINIHKKALFAKGSIGEPERLFVEGSTSGRYDIFLLKQSEGLTGTIYHEEPLESLCEGEGTLCSVMLHPERNIILFSVDYTHIKIFLKIPYSVSIVEFDESGKQKKQFMTYTNTLFKKIIYIGCNTYVGLTSNNMLATLWPNHNNQIVYKEQKHQSRFIDIAVDESRKTAKGFRPYIACLSTEGNLFVSNIFAFDKPTLFLTKKIPNHQQAFRLFYDKSQCAVLYKAIPEVQRNCTNYTDFLVWPDNFGIHYINKVLGLAPLQIQK
jgi:hypothetical protein